MQNYFYERRQDFVTFGLTNNTIPVFRAQIAKESPYYADQPMFMFTLLYENVQELNKERINLANKVLDIITRYNTQSDTTRIDNEFNISQIQEALRIIVTFYYIIENDITLINNGFNPAGRTQEYPIDDDRIYFPQTGFVTTTTVHIENIDPQDFIEDVNTFINRVKFFIISNGTDVGNKFLLMDLQAFITRLTTELDIWLFIYNHQLLTRTRRNYMNLNWRYWLNERLNLTDEQILQKYRV